MLLSGRGEEEAVHAEQLLQDAWADWTTVRCSWFSQNFSEKFIVDGVRVGVVALPVNGVREPFVDAEDIADVAVAALTEDGHSGRLYELTGPRLLSFEDAVREIADATGRHIRFVPLAIAEFTSALAEEGLSADAVALISYLFTDVLDGRNESRAWSG